ncbi:ATP-binding protein [Luteibacter sp. RCC_6_2]|uniref:ATP-binding protein n=1 Tax=Luteibacter sp. RCC_6_2 TaxID=3239223 RepID=UPI0035253AB9
MDAKKVKANPTKTFFVEMITRDISVEDCILDLIDNSVDGAWALAGSHPMHLDQGADLTPYTVSITADGEHFTVTDNCGGMSLDDAIERAFSFGRRPDDGHDEFSIGVYGIGMKRAVFKLGRDVSIRSTHTNGARQESFEVAIDVDDWMADETLPWDFDLNPAKPLDADGVQISVKRLTPGSSSALASPAFIQNLRRTISRDYALHLAQGLNIYINGICVKGWEIELLDSEEISPLRLAYTENVNGIDVRVEIVGGMAAPPPENSDPDTQADGEKRFGWYVACNGRIVLAADKSETAGWGTDGWPQWHRQYAGFVGLIHFSSENAIALPLTTTKRNVDVSSEVYRRARPKMREIAKSWIAYTNVRKQALDDAKLKESQARPVALSKIEQRSAITLPVLTPKTKELTANIAYSMPISRVRDLANGFGNINMSYREVGLRSFDYAFSDFVSGQ